MEWANASKGLKLPKKVFAVDDHRNKKVRKKEAAFVPEWWAGDKTAEDESGSEANPITWGQRALHTGLGFGGLMAGAGTLDLGSLPGARQMIQASQYDIGDRRSNLLKRFLGRKGVDIDFPNDPTALQRLSHKMTGVGPPRFLATASDAMKSRFEANLATRSGGTIVAPAGRSYGGMLMHEAGHSLQPRWSLLGGALGKHVTGLGAIGAATAIDEDNAFGAALGGTAGGLATMSNELGASRRGGALAKRLHKAPYQLRGLRRFGPYAGLSSYAVTAALPMLAYGTKKFFGGYNSSGTE